MQEEYPITHRALEVVIVGLHLRWSGVWQRPHHLLSHAALDVPVVIVEEPFAASRDEDVVVADGAVTVITPHRVATRDALDERTLGTVSAQVAGRQPLVWLYTPMMLGLADLFPGAPLVFDKMDELADFAGADPRIRTREAALFARASLVFTGGRSLHRTVEGRTRRARCYPSGVDVHHFAAARTIQPHPDLCRAGGRVLLYVGVIDERIDVELVAAIADAYPASTVAMVGPVVKIDPGSLPRRPNLAYLGQRSYGELPALLAAADVALMPFALNRHTARISPTKTLEYLAAGVPVVSTAVPDVVSEYEGVVHVARDHAEFLALIGIAQEQDRQRAERAERKVRSAAWDAIWASMRDDLLEAGVPYPTGALHAAASLD